MSSATVTTSPNTTPFYALLIANIISLSGSAMSIIAVPWFVLETTHSASKTGISAFFTTMPAVIAAFFGSGLVDRLGYKRSSVFSDIAAGFMMALIPLFYLLGLLQFPLLLVFVFFASLFEAPGATARYALISDVAELGAVPLERAVALGDGASRAARLLGVPIGGALIAWLGPTVVLWVDASTFVISAVLVSLLVPRLVAAHKKEEEQVNYREHLLSGLRFLWNERLILAITATAMITNMLDGAMTAVLAPIYGQTILHSSVAQGFLSGAFGLGAVISTFLFSIFGTRLPRRPTIIICFTLMSVRYFALGSFLAYPILIAFYLFCGVAVGPINPIASTIEFERIPANMRARVFGALSAGSLLAIPVGVLLVGYVVDALGLQTTLLTIGVIYVATTLSLWINPAARDMSKPAVNEPADDSQMELATSEG